MARKNRDEWITLRVTKQVKEAVTKDAMSVNRSRSNFLINLWQDWKVKKAKKGGK